MSDLNWHQITKNNNYRGGKTTKQTKKRNHLKLIILPLLIDVSITNLWIQFMIFEVLQKKYLYLSTFYFLQRKNYTNLWKLVASKIVCQLVTTILHCLLCISCQRA